MVAPVVGRLDERVYGTRVDVLHGDQNLASTWSLLVRYGKELDVGSFGGGSGEYSREHYRTSFL
jgi:hypothetical protein